KPFRFAAPAAQHRDATHSSLPVSRGRVLHTRANYLGGNADRDVYEERQGPDNTPHWSPDGGSPPVLFR
ncbi:MAG: hypothetical protein ABEI99_09855, partial [Halobaculum sp.]